MLLVKSAIWIISLGSGTSGGVVAPLLMTGAALGGVEALFLPHFGRAFGPWPAWAATLARPWAARSLERFSRSN